MKLPAITALVTAAALALAGCSAGDQGAAGGSGSQTPGTTTEQASPAPTVTVTAPVPPTPTKTVTAKPSPAQPLPTSLPDCWPTDCALPYEESSQPLSVKLAGQIRADVAYLQLALNQCAGAGLAADGDFGPRTDNAVRSLQQYYRDESPFRDPSIEVDGIVGPVTARLIGFLCIEGV